MRERKYKDGTHGCVNLPYESIPDNYDIKSWNIFGGGAYRVELWIDLEEE